MSRCILHISGDYPDSYQAAKTPVIKYLVDELSGCSKNIVVSLNRVSRPDQASVSRVGDVLAIKYFSLPFGFFQSYFLDRLAVRIAKLMRSENISPDIVIGHKFTIESWLAWRVAQYFNIPYIAAFMGNSDRKIYQVKPHYRARYRRIATKASALVFPTCWCRDYFVKKLLRNSNSAVGNKIQVIPYISSVTVEPSPSAFLNSKHFLVICRLDIWRIKNIHRLIKAMARLRQESPDWKLDIVGQGSASAESEIRRVINCHGVSAGVTLLGGKTRSEIDSILPRYSAMVMPSYPESFGLVYLEALAKGVPIMTAKNSGFDGFFPNAFPGVVVSHASIDEIVSGLRSLAEHGNDYRRVISESKDEFALFDRNAIVDRYKKLFSI